MTKRQHALVAARIAGYHYDTRTFTRLLIENRVSRLALNEQWRTGQKMKEAGLGCTCRDCAGTP